MSVTSSLVAHSFTKKKLALPFCQRLHPFVESLMQIFVEFSQRQEVMSLDYSILFSQLQAAGLKIAHEDLEDGCLKCGISDGIRSTRTPLSSCCNCCAKQ